MDNKLNAVMKKLKTKFQQVKLQNKAALIVFVMLLATSFSFSVQAASQNIDEAKSIIKDYYVTPVSDSVLNGSTIEDIVKNLNDPYSEYFSKQGEQDFINAINNKTSGIGVSVEMVKEGVKVKEVMEGSPALAAGIHEGDIIISADGKSLAGMYLQDAVSYVKGEADTTVKIKVKRGETTLDFSIVRKEISVPTITAKILNGHTAYIDIVSFGEDTADLFSKKLQEMNMKNPDNYIIDLRNNGGGYMGTAIDIAVNFIGSKPSVIVEDRQGGKISYYSAKKGNLIDKPVIFLINENSASASEILSAAIKDYKKAFFVGATTYGKGVAQQMFPLSDGSALKITTEKFYSPQGHVIQKVGVTPDFAVKDVDSQAVAELFSGKCVNNVDKRGYARITYGGKDFEIDLNLAKDERHWAAFKYILGNVPKDKVYIGTETEGYVQVPARYFDNLYSFLYSDVKSLDTMKDAPKDKVFTITFNKKVDEETIKNKINLELIDIETGKRAAFDIKSIDGNKVSIAPKENLESGKTYYIKVNNTLRPVTVKQDKK